MKWAFSFGCRTAGPLERVCRYILRAPVAVERLHLTDDGHVRLSLRQPWRDGTTDFVFDPVEFLGRLAVLVPRPRINLLLYYACSGHDPHGAQASSASIDPIRAVAV